MPSANEEKQPSEVVRLTADFSQALLTGEAIVALNAGVSVSNMLTDADATASILVPASVVIDGTTISAQVQGGVVGDLYKVFYSTGSTNFLNVYDATATLSVTNTPASDTLICTLSELKQTLRIPESDTSDDATLMQMIGFATAYAQSRTARTLFFGTFTEDIYREQGDPKHFLHLWEYPVRQIDSILVFYPLYTTPTTPIVLDPTSYTFTEEGKVRLYPTGFIWPNIFPHEPGFTRVVYRGGFARIPDDLRQACQGVASVFYRNLGREGLTSERIGDYSYSLQNPIKLPSGATAELADPMINGVIARYGRTSITRY